jgi:hypothetical protein
MHINHGRSRVLVPINSLNSFNRPNLSSRTKQQEFTQLLTEMSAKRSFLNKAWLCLGPTTLPLSVSRLSTEYRSLDVSQPFRPPRSCTFFTLLCLPKEDRHSDCGHCMNFTSLFHTEICITLPRKPEQAVMPSKCIRYVSASNIVRSKYSLD